MTYTTKKDGNTLEIVVTGRLDTVSAPDLEKALMPLPEGVNTLVYDFGKLDYISSAGLRVLLSAHKIMMKQGQMKIINASEIVKEVFDVTGFSDILNIA